MRVYGRLCTLLLALGVLAGVAPSASALVVHDRDGHFFGITLHRGVKPASTPDALGGTHAAGRALTGTAAPGNDPTLTYHGGPVLHSSAPYLIFWSPSGDSISAGWESLIERYFGDVATASGAATNVYGVGRQYTDGAGFADYRQTFNVSTQVFNDTSAYPSRDRTSCAGRFSSYAKCITDTQLQTEIARMISAKGLPNDGPTGNSELSSSAPIYFVVLPTDVDVCMSDGSGECASTKFCAYHSFFADGGNNVLYATIPTLALDNVADAKSCQPDGNSNVVEQPNGNYADVALKYISHEDNETITDPLINAWWDDNGGSTNNNVYYGNENGDDCNDVGSSPNAFQPAIGGSASAGTLYNQLINGNKYYLQSEWSNGDGNCEMQPQNGSLSAQFATPSGTATPGESLRFDPAGSTSTNPYAGVTWNWGDSSSPTFAASGPSAASHTYSSPGTYTVTLTLVDNRGNTATVFHQVTVSAPPTARIAGPSQPVAGVALKFDGSGSTDPNAGGSVAAYQWNFGDGGTDTGSAPTHTFAAPGTYTVTLTVTDAVSLSSTTSEQVTVALASFTANPNAAAVGQSVAFSASGPSTNSYTWNFGDGTTPASGSAPSHSYASSGTYTVKLTADGTNGETETLNRQVTVGPIAAFMFTPAGGPADGQAVTFDGSSSADPEPGQSIAKLSWDFGDGSGAEGTRISHAYSNPGTYRVTLTVTNGAGESNTSAPQTITVSDTPPTAAFSLSSASPSTSETVQFDGSSSAPSDPNAVITTYRWKFGDGSSGSGPSVGHAYSAPGNYTVQLTVTDSYGVSTTVSQTVTVRPPLPPTPAPDSPDEPPAAVLAVAPGNLVNGVPVAFSGAGSNDPDGTITAYRWSFGDGASATGAAPSHAYGRAGTYSVALTVTDSAGQSTTAMRSVTIGAAGRITGLRIKQSRGGATIAATVSGAGKLSAGGHVIRCKHAGTVKVELALTRAQLATLRRRHPVKLHVALRFVPVVGATATASMVIAFHPAGASFRVTAVNTR